MARSGGTRRVGRYLLYGELASGGMATVHVGRLVGPVGFSRTVAVKCLHPHLAKDPEFVAMFIDEARLAARIAHPNVVHVLDVVAMDDELFLVMDYVQGETVARLVRSARGRDDRLPPQIAASIVAGALPGPPGAQGATNHGGERLEIVHRDVSPQNVMVGVDGVARVLDFGVAKAAERVLQTTREGQLKGKLAYMAPEQLRAGHVNRQTDVYAASVVLWEALTGERLFAGDSTGEVLDKVLLSEVVPPSARVTGLPATYDAIVLRGLARERTERFSTAREMAVALEGVGVASTTEVGDWVQAEADEVLAGRARWIATMETGSDVAPAAEEAPLPLSTSEAAPLSGPSAAPDASGGSVDERPSPASRRGQVALLVAAAAVVAMAAALLRRSAPASAGVGSPAAPPESAASGSVPAAASSSAADDTAGPSPPPVAQSGTASDPGAPVPAPPPSPEATHAAAGAPRPHAGAPSKSDCNPPYTVSPSGKKTYKRNCL